MKIIGITGGVGCGKSSLLKTAEQKYNCRVIYADLAAHKVEEKGQMCYDKLVKLLGDVILDENGAISKEKMAKAMFDNREILGAVNAIVHPAVKEYILSQIQYEKERGVIDVLFIEAALLIEDGYLAIVDELWYVFADIETRIERLSKTRGYTKEKSLSIMDSQLTDEQFREAAACVIDNNSSLENGIRIFEEQLGAICGRR